MRLPGYSLVPGDMKPLQIRCLDPALSVRKQAMVSLMEVLRSFPESETVMRLWWTSVVPMVNDREDSVQNK